VFERKLREACKHGVGQYGGRAKVFMLQRETLEKGILCGNIRSSGWG